MRFEKFLRVSFFLCAISYNYFVNTVYFCVLRIYLMSYNLLSDCFICDLQLLVVLTASERHINAYIAHFFNRKYVFKYVHLRIYDTVIYVSYDLVKLYITCYIGKQKAKIS